ncbi:alpha/beta fold hydrolase, partial [Marinobacter halodurans]
WQELLGVERVSRHDNFFALGGHSLLAVRLIERMRQAELQADVQVLFKHPSLAELAKNVSLAQKVSSHQALALRTTGFRKPLFIVHDGLGLDSYISGLADHIDSDTPIYGLSAIPADEPQPPTLQEQACRHVKMIRDVQPEGPYRIAGWCAGGFFAYEIAVQLLGQDQQVEFVGLFDSYAPETRNLREDWTVNTFLLEFCNELGRTKGLAESCASMANELGFFDLLERFREMRALPEKLESLKDEQIWQLSNRCVVISKAISAYSRFPVPMPIHLFIAEEKAPGGIETDDAMGWTSTMPSHLIRKVKVPGNHETMVKGHAPTLGSAINQALSEVEATDFPKQEAAYRPLVSLQTGRVNEVPVVCLPGAGDSVISMMGLVDAIGTDRPAYGLQPRGLEGNGTVPHSTVEAAAACYLDAIADIVARGPVHLIGHSFGGWVAFEMALRLQMAGRSVASLMLIDSHPPLPPSPYTSDDVLTELLDALELSSGQCLASAKSLLRGKSDKEQLEILCQAMVDTSQVPASASPEMFQGVLRTFAAGLRTSYRPSHSYEHPLHMVLCPDPRKDGPSNEQTFAKHIESWREFAPELKCQEVRGNHFTILRPPYVADLSKWWKANCLL